MIHDRGAVWRRRYGKLLFADLTGAQLIVDVEPGLDKSEMRERLREEFDANPRVGRLLVRIDGVDVGTADRAEAGRDPGHAGAADAGFDPGAGDGATLPGHPAQFRAVWFRCRDRACPEVALRSFHDERLVPECPDRHGAMELRP